MALYGKPATELPATRHVSVPHLRLRSHGRAFKYESVFWYTARTSFTRTSGASAVTCTNTTRRVSTDNLQQNRIE